METINGQGSVPLRNTDSLASEALIEFRTDLFFKAHARH